jgi:type IV pilus assembly protein PilQ
MTVTRRVVLLVSLAIGGGLFDLPGAAAGAGIQLTAIRSRVHATGVSLTIEASEPVAYVTTRPDPLTVVVDFRHVDGAGVVEPASAVRGGAIARVTVEPADADTTRVRLALTEPVAHRVRSERNSIIVDLERTGTPFASLAQAQTPAPAQAQIQATSAIPATSGCGARPYTGDPVSLDFQVADLRAVLRTFAEISGLNIVIDPTIQGSVDVVLRQVPWDQAFDQILRANGLDCTIDGTIVRVATVETLEAEAQKRIALAQAQVGEAPLTTRTWRLSYAKGEDLVRLLESAGMISARGQPFTDPRTNTLIITDVDERLQATASLISTLDVPQPQVEIEARIVQTTRDFARALGVQWGFNGRVSPALGNTTNLAFPNSGQLSGDTNIGVDRTTESVLDLALGSVNGAFDLDVALSALETSGNGRLLSTPRVSTQNNVPAEIMQGTQIPIQTVSNNTVTVQFQDAALKLRVTPQISAAGTVIMAIELENSEPDFARAVNGIPPINTQSALTTVLVKDGETTVIGGIYLSRESQTTRRTPGLSRIPLLRWLFRRDDVEDVSTELLIFITPRIVQGVAQ